MALTPADIRIGARRMIWDLTGANVDLGMTLEDSSVLRIEQGGEEVMAEQTGIATVDFIYAGVKATFRGAFREWGDPLSSPVLDVLLPGALAGTGAVVREFRFGEVAGVSARSIARSLTFRREIDVNFGANPADEDIEFYLACPLVVSDIALDNRARSGIWTCSFLALVDFSQQVGNGNLLGRWKTDRT